MNTREGKAVFNFESEDWAHLRARAIDAFDGELPNNHTEQLIIEAYEAHPEAVRKALSQVATDFTKGTIRSGWGVTKNRAERILSPPSNPSAATGIDKERAIQRAEQWMKTTGAHYDRQTEVLEELFGAQGRLHAYAQIKTIETGRNEQGHAIYALSEPTGDLALIERMTHLWDQARPAGIKIEEDAHARAEKWKTDQARIGELKAQVVAELDAQQVDTDPEATLDDDIPF